MATAIFNECPEVGYTYRDEIPIATLRYEGPYDEVRKQLGPLARRVYSWRLQRDAAGRQTVDDFIVRARKFVESFYVKDPKDFARAGVALTPSPAGGGHTVFSLPTAVTDEDYRHFPIDDANVVVYETGVPTAAVVTVQTDARTFTLSVPPVAGKVMTADFHAYRLVVCRVAPTWSSESSNWFGTSLDISEIVRDLT